MRSRSIAASLRRRVTPLVLALTASALVATPAAVEAQAPPSPPVVMIDWTVDAQTRIASLDIDVDIPGGSFVGSADLGTGIVTGELSLPEATAPVKLLGLPLATMTFKTESVGPVTGTIDLKTLMTSLTSTFHIHLTSLTPLGLPLNLVGDNCRTTTPISVTMTGTFDLAAGTTLSGEYAIPTFENCGPLTPILNLLVPGDGNTFSATAKPRTA